MVRLKTRWLLVRIEADEIAPSRKELANAIRDNLLQCFGVAAAGAAYETQVRWCDSETRLALIRVPRQFCPTVRASVTLLNRSSSCSKRGDGGVVLACHVVSVHGSARTAKIQTMRRVQNVYRDRLVRSMRDDDDGDDNNTEVLLPQPSQIRRAKNRRKTGYNEETIKLCLAMQDTLAQIVAIDF